MVGGGDGGRLVGCAWCGDRPSGGAAVGVLLGAVAVDLGQGVVSFRWGVYRVYLDCLRWSEGALGVSTVVSTWPLPASTCLEG